MLWKDKGIHYVDVGLEMEIGGLSPTKRLWHCTQLLHTPDIATQGCHCLSDRAGNDGA